MKNSRDEELGENAFYRILQHQARLDPAALLAEVRGGLEAFAEGQPFPNDISIVALARGT